MAISLSNNNNHPKKVGIIMDGNGRWAKFNKLKINKGHEKGVGVVRDVVKECIAQNIESLTIYAFSSENWSRPQNEINGIKKLIVRAIDDQVPELKEQNVMLDFFGDLSSWGDEILGKISKAENDTFEELNTNESLHIEKEEDFLGDGDFEEDSPHRKKSSSQLHTCNICKKKFRKLQSLEKHLTLHTTSMGKFSHMICQKIY